MKYFFLVFFTISFQFVSLAQIEIDRLDNFLLNQNISLEKTDTPKGLINLAGGYHANSSAFTNEFMNKLVFGGFIEESQKDNVTGRLKANNRFGFDLNAGVSSKIPLKGSTIIIGLNHREFYNAGFTKDAFELTFRGNKSFAGKSAAFAPFKYSHFNYENLFIGIEKNLSEKITLGGGVSLIRGGNFQYLNVDRGSLFTEQNGEYLDMDMKFDMAYSQSSYSLFPQSNGLGAAVNLNFAYTQEKSQINFEIRDLGMISWQNLSTLKGDSSFRFEGKEIQDIFSFDDEVFSDISRDSIASIFKLKKETKNIKYFIPASFHLNYQYRHSEKISFVVGIKQMINAKYIPRIYIKPIYYLKNDFIIAPTIAYGGFGRADFELGLAKNFNNSFLISANIFYLEAILLPKKSAGQGFTVSLTKIF